MQKLFVAVAAASMIGVAYPASAQFAREQKAEQSPTATTGSMHDHTERAERVLKQLLQQRPANDTSRSAASKSDEVAVERTQLERLQTELKEINAASSDTSPKGASALDEHVVVAQNIATSLANRPVTPTEPQGRVEIVTVERSTLKQLKDEIEAIEKLSKTRHQK